ncbi:MAG: hypothetical protein QNJ16_04325 [Rhodobacter sp.]|nr:hypothetical protein [Rhodobacter sp.]
MLHCVPARRRRSRLPGLIAALFLWAAGPVWAEPNAETPAEAGAQSLSLNETRAVALQAALTGQPHIAAPLAAALLRNDPDDEYALLAMSALQLGTGDSGGSYRSGRLAFRHAEDAEVKFHAARMTAVAAMADNRTIATQFWLRRAGDLAPSPAQRARVERNYRIFQAKNPWRYRLDFSATPSSNVNGGAESPYNIIDGVPLVGILSSDAQALSGWIAQGKLDLSYRVQRNARSQTDLTGSAYAKRVWLSDDAQAKAPGFDAGDLSAEEFTAGVRYSRRLRKPGEMVQLAGRFSHYRQGGAASYDAVTGSAYYRRPLSGRLDASGQIEAEWRDYAGGGGSGRVLRGSAGLSYRFADGGRLSGSVYVGDTDSPNTNFDNRAVYGKLTYALGKPVMDLGLSASIGASLSDYPDYALGFIPVPGGRRDEGLFADLDITFEKIEYAGFSPHLKIRRQRTSSNVSRFTTSEWAVSVGIRSNF